MNRTWSIVGVTVTWCAIAAFIAAAALYSSRKRGEVTVGDTRISILDSASLNVIGTAMVKKWLAEGNFDISGKPAAEVNTAAIAAHLKTHPEVKVANVWVNLDGVLTVEVAPRRSALRVRSSNGYRFWLTDDNYIIPDRGEFTSYVPVVTGYTPFPFGVNAKGSYDAMKLAVWQDFLGQFTGIEEERRSLAAQKAAVREQIREARLKRPKRFWSDARKTEFMERRHERITALQEETARLDVAAAALAERKNALREKEKKSQQSHRFLTKLANFAKSVENDGFWASQIVQINVLGDAANGSAAWKEPRIELVPRAGDHIVMLGELDGREAARLEKLRVFYRNALAREGWDTQRYINIRYDGQIVCTK